MAARATRKLAAVTPPNAHSSVHLGDHLRDLRKAEGWSIEAAASKAGLSANTLANIERSAFPNPTLSTLLALVEIYRLRSVEELFGRLPSRVVLAHWVASGRPGSRS